MNDDQVLGEFTGKARLFPLPNLVLFPHVVQPLHVFEARYQQMTEDALTGDRFIAAVLLRPGWEDLYQGNPAIHKTACLGRIIAEQQLDDGRYNILLRGMRRVRLRRELNNDRLYRMAQVDLLDDNPPETPELSEELRKELGESLLPRFETKGEIKKQVKELFRSQLLLGTLCDVLTFALPFPPEMKQGLLDQLDVSRRVRQLIDLVDALKPAPAELIIGHGRKFPPDFSDN